MLVFTQKPDSHYDDKMSKSYEYPRTKLDGSNFTNSHCIQKNVIAVIFSPKTKKTHSRILGIGRIGNVDITQKKDVKGRRRKNKEFRR